MLQIIHDDEYDNNSAESLIFGRKRLQEIAKISQHEAKPRFTLLATFQVSPESVLSNCGFAVQALMLQSPVARFTLRSYSILSWRD